MMVRKFNQISVKILNLIYLILVKYHVNGSWFWDFFQGFLGELPLILFSGVAVLAESPGINLFLSMLTLSGLICAAITVVTAIAHPLSVVLQLCVFAPGYLGSYLGFTDLLRRLTLWYCVSFEVEKAFLKVNFFSRIPLIILDILVENLDRTYWRELEYVAAFCSSIVEESWV